MKKLRERERERDVLLTSVMTAMINKAFLALIPSSSPNFKSSYFDRTCLLITINMIPLNKPAAVRNMVESYHVDQ